MAINIFSVQNDLEEKGWQLVSTEYVNLSSPLKMICPRGHDVEDSYGHWRKYCICEKCMGGKGSHIKKEIPLKTDGVYRILALDAATVTTGFSVYDNNELVSYGTFHANADLDTTERINKVRKWLTNLIDEHCIDEIVLEQIQLQSFNGNPNSPQVQVFQTLANLQGVILDTAFELDIPCELIYSSTWRHVCGITEGRTREEKKKAAQVHVKSWYGLDATQDEADAICLGKCRTRQPKKKIIWGE